MYSEDKPKINQYVFEDANLYLKHLKLKKENYEFVPSFSETDEAVCNFLSAEYSKLPDNIAPDCYAWLRVQRPRETLIYKEEQSHQVNFIEDIMWLFYKNKAREWLESDYRTNLPRVINTHTSKGVTLPVFKLAVPILEVTFYARCNLYDWVISVDSNNSIDANFHHLFKEDTRALYTQGMKEEYVFGPYSKDHKQFTVELRNYYQVYTFFYIIADYLYELYDLEIS